VKIEPAIPGLDFVTEDENDLTGSYDDRQATLYTNVLPVHTYMHTYEFFVVW